MSDSGLVAAELPGVRLELVFLQFVETLPIAALESFPDVPETALKKGLLQALITECGDVTAHEHLVQGCTERMISVPGIEPERFPGLYAETCAICELSVGIPVVAGIEVHVPHLKGGSDPPLV